MCLIEREASCSRNLNHVKTLLPKVFLKRTFLHKGMLTYKVVGQCDDTPPQP